MSEEDPQVERDREVAEQRGRDEPRALGPLLQQVLAAKGLSHDDIPEFSDPDELRAAREEFMRRAPARHAAPVPEPQVPRKFWDVRFDATEPRPETDNWSMALKRCKQWVRMVADSSPASLALIGPKGNSKSHLAYCAAWELYEAHNVYATCFSWVRIADILRWNNDDAQPLRERLMGTPVLVLDEVRPTSGTDFDAMELAKISMVRYDEELPTLVTCNWESLEQVMGDPAADRFTQVVLNGPSYRERSA